MESEAARAGRFQPGDQLQESALATAALSGQPKDFTTFQSEIYVSQRFNHDVELFVGLCKTFPLQNGHSVSSFPQQEA